jgi:two-component system, response regulator YesN
MRNILLVDDEPLVRIAVKSLVHWEQYGYRISYEAANGKQALQILANHQDVELVITDISMPVMDGLQLVQALHEQEFRGQILVLSSYQDYDLVRKAFKMGAKDYILKTEMKPEALLELVNQLFETASDKGEPEKQLAMEGERWKTNWLRDLIQQDGMEYGEDPVKRLKLRFHPNCIVVGTLFIDQFSQISLRYDKAAMKPFVHSVTHAIEQVLLDAGVGEAVALTSCEYVIILSLTARSFSAKRIQLLEILGRIRYSLKNYINLSVTIGVSGFGDGYQSVSALYRQAKMHAGLRFFYGWDQTFFPEQMEALPVTSPPKIIGKEEAFLTALQKCDKELARVELNHFFDGFKPGKTLELDKNYAGYMEILFLLNQYIEGVGDHKISIFGMENDEQNMLMAFETMEEIQRWLQDRVDRTLDYFMEKRERKGNRVIQRAMDYMDKYYSNPDLTLSSISTYSELSESYFSMLFAKEAGVSFVDYLTHVRIENAKVLLNQTNLKLYEVSERVGYTNTDYFGRVFKKATGKSPIQFRNQNQS